MFPVDRRVEIVRNRYDVFLSGIVCFLTRRLDMVSVKKKIIVAFMSKNL